MHIDHQHVLFWRVGDGRGFVVACRNYVGHEERIVIAAAHTVCRTSRQRIPFRIWRNGPTPGLSHGQPATGAAGVGPWAGLNR
jgi:hypothetical protein